LGFAKNFSSVIIDNFFEFFLLELEKSNNIKISSFGTFKVSQKKERIGRNPHTKVEAKITARKVVKFRPSIQITKKINNQ
jgi:integration host factor subunit alpha